MMDETTFEKIKKIGERKLFTVRAYDGVFNYIEFEDRYMVITFDLNYKEWYAYDKGEIEAKVRIPMWLHKLISETIKLLGWKA